MKPSKEPTMIPAKKQAHVLITGIVQGVSFRYSTHLQANTLGVNGWVKNLPDGRVEAVFEGDEDKVDKIVKWCHQGPTGAVVSNIKVNWQECSGEFKGFTIRG
ncbi:MAG: acylphosphatase [bacterium]